MNTTPCHSPKGFTLIELLVVIAIIAILASLLLPVLAGSKASARRLECLNRMKQWSFAFNSYPDENEGSIPREGYHWDGNVSHNNWAQVSDEIAKDVWYNALAAYMSGVRPASSYAYPAEPAPFYEPQSFFHCPSAPLPKDAAGNLNVLFSMAMNSQLIEVGRAPTIKFSRIQHPSQTALFLDNLLEGDKRVVPAQVLTDLGQPASYPPRFAGVRHRGTGNIGFGDGHVESLPGNKVVAPDGQPIVPPVDVLWGPDD